MNGSTNLAELNGWKPPITKDVPLSSIAVDRGCQSRAVIDSETVDDYAESIRSGTEMPPAVVFYDGAQYWLAGGFHRREAHAKAGKPSMLCEVREGTRRDAVLFSVGANATHGLRRKSEDKRRAVLTLLADSEWSRWSNREIARACGVSEFLVRSLRDTAIKTQCAERTFVHRDGHTTKMLTGNIGRTAPKPEDFDPLLNEGCSDGLSEESSPPACTSGGWESFNAAVGECIEQLGQAKAKLYDVLGYDPKAKKFSTKWANGMSFLGTLGGIDQIASNLRNGLPAEWSPSPPGYLTTRQAKIKRAGKAVAR